MKIPLFCANAFVGKGLQGNAAVVCPLESWLSDAVLQGIARQNNVSETAFLVRDGEQYRLRWFTPTLEVDLCGHATLAAAYLIFERLEPGRNEVVFRTCRGPLRAWRSGGMISLDFPADNPIPAKAPAGLSDGLGVAPVEVWIARDYMAVYESEEQVRALLPDSSLLCRLDRPGVIATAPGLEADFVSRYFAPQEGIPEDPVTGSAHCTLAPYWAKRLDRSHLHAIQVSRRGGELWCEARQCRVILSGYIAPAWEGAIEVSESAVYELAGSTA